MGSEANRAVRVERLRESYAEIGGPDPDGWDGLLSVSDDHPVSLINFFAFRDVADYGESSASRISGREAFDRYAEVSGPTLDGVGGRFVHIGSHRGNLVGDFETWDLIVVGEYPNVDALLALHEDPAYRAAYRHRVAACSRQRVLVSA